MDSVIVGLQPLRCSPPTPSAGSPTFPSEPLTVSSTRCSGATRHRWPVLSPCPPATGWARTPIAPTTPSLWVLDGRAVILGEELDAGSYVHVPSGVDHDLDATATNGCTVFYLYIRHDT